MSSADLPSTAQGSTSSYLGGDQHFQQMANHALQSNALHVDFIVDKNCSFQKKNQLLQYWSRGKAYFFGWNQERKENLINIKQAFTDYSNKVSLKETSLSPELQAVFTDFLSGKKTASHVVRALYKEFLLKSLKESTVSPLEPQEIFDGDRSILIEPAPAIENLVLAGGGARGTAYVGIYRALEKSDQLQQLSSLAGSSAGAITAAMIATGMDATTFEDVFRDINMTDILMKSSSNRDLKETLNLSGRGFSGSYGMESLNTAINHSVIKLFEENMNDYENRLNPVKNNSKQQSRPQDYALFRQLKEKLLAPDASKKVFITFKELDLLNRLRPEKFKKLNLTGFDLKRQETIYFDAESTPDMTLVQAVRASMALPGVFQKVMINGREVIDGGIASKYPVEIFSPTVSKQLKEWKSMAADPSSTTLLRYPDAKGVIVSESNGRDLLADAVQILRKHNSDYENKINPPTDPRLKQQELYNNYPLFCRLREKLLSPKVLPSQVFITFEENEFLFHLDSKRFEKLYDFINSKKPNREITVSRQEAELNAKTMILAFEKNGFVPQLLFAGKVKKEPNYLERFGAWMLKIPNLFQDQNVDKKKLWELGPQVRTIFHGQLSTLSFFAGKTTIEAVQEQAEIKMLEQLLQRCEEGVSYPMTS